MTDNKKDFNSKYKDSGRPKSTIDNELRYLELQAEYYKERFDCIQKKQDNKISQIRSLEEESEITKIELENIANTKPYRIAYLLRRFSLEFKNGNIDDKKSFINWLYCKLARKENKSKHKYNPLWELAKK